MRIGLFTDTYLPAVNGIVYVVNSLKRQLEDEGHEVFVFCPKRSFKSQDDNKIDEEDHVIRFFSIKGVFYEDYDTSLFFPPFVLARIRELNLDIIHFFTPGQIGLMGVYAGFKINIPIVAQHCTDLRHYVEHYSDGPLLPGLLALLGLLPFTIKVNGKDIREIISLYKPRLGRVQWNIDIVERMVTLIYSKCNAVIALSRKSKWQLESWQKNDNYSYKVTLLPNGVDPLPSVTKEEVDDFKHKYKISPKDKVFGFVGRLGAEKNLDLLISAFEIVNAVNPNVKLLFVGDFEYRKKLEELARNTKSPEKIIFTGIFPREKLNVIYSVLDVFVFPSLTDTQGWVVHEAALAQLPLILVDTEVSEVMRAGINGLYTTNDPSWLADAILELLSDDEKRKRFGKESRKLALQFTEKNQTKKLISIYQDTIRTFNSNLKNNPKD